MITKGSNTMISSSAGMRSSTRPSLPDLSDYSNALVWVCHMGNGPCFAYTLHDVRDPSRSLAIEDDVVGTISPSYDIIINIYHINSTYYIDNHSSSHLATERLPL